MFICSNSLKDMNMLKASCGVAGSAIGSDKSWSSLGEISSLLSLSISSRSVLFFFCLVNSSPRILAAVTLTLMKSASSLDNSKQSGSGDSAGGPSRQEVWGDDGTGLPSGGQLHKSQVGLHNKSPFDLVVKSDFPHFLTKNVHWAW